MCIHARAHTNRDRQRDRQRDRETHTHTHTHRERERERERERDHCTPPPSQASSSNSLLLSPCVMPTSVPTNTAVSAESPDVAGRYQGAEGGRGRSVVGRGRERERETERERERERERASGVRASQLRSAWRMSARQEEECREARKIGVWRQGRGTPDPYIRSRARSLSFPSFPSVSLCVCVCLNVSFPSLDVSVSFPSLCGSVSFTWRSQHWQETARAPVAMAT